MHCSRLIVAAAAVTVGACATNPATGRKQLILMSEGQEAALGKEADQQAVAAYGLYPDEQVQAYVGGLGRKLAAASEKPSLPWSFKVVDDATVNAFALPGGYIYVTRGLMTHLRTEAELVSVLGHEIGHVTGRHSASQMSKQQLAMGGLIVGMMVEPELQRFGGLAQQGLGVLFLKFGRDHENEADELGLRYMTREDYDPREMVEVFSVLDRLGEASGEGRLPAWLSTHPAPANRAQRIQSEIQAQQLSGTRVEGPGYVQRLEGVVFGENPREGFFEGGRFYHPDLRFQLQFPAGWKTQNTKQAVAAMSPQEDALVVMTLVPGTSAEQAATQFMRQQGLRPAGAERTSLHGLPAVTGLFEAVADQTPIAGRVTFVEHDGKVYRLLGYTPSERWRNYDRVFAESLISFAPLTDRRYLDVQPKRVDVVPVSQPITVAELARRHGASVSADVLALINHVAPGATLPAGQPAKIVVGGRLPNEDRRQTDGRNP